MRLIAIGDIHGMDRQLENLLDRVQPGSDDRLVFLGDYIDRGPDSRRVLERLMDLAEKRPDAIFLRGNHEQMLLDALAEQGRYAGPTLQELSPRYAMEAGNATLLYLMNGGGALLKSYGIGSLSAGLPPEHLAFLEATRLFWEHAPYLFVHAGADPKLPPRQQDPFTLLWDRTSPPGRNGTIHVVGHQPTAGDQPEFESGRYRIDTGAGHGRVLTACDVLTRRIWQA